MTEKKLSMTPNTKYFSTLKLSHQESDFKAVGLSFTSSTELGKQLVELIGSDAQEVFWALYTDCHLNVIGATECAKGGLSDCMVEPRQIFQHALLCNANGMVLVHNHPGQDLKPSNHDKAFIKKMRSASKLMGISFIDCMIVDSDNYLSFAERGLM